MNKHDLREFLHTELEPYASSFHETSFDKENNVHLCSDKKTENVYDFDKYIAARCNTELLPASPDAIHVGKKNLYFVEFKNQRANKVDAAQIRRKFAQGTTILKELLDQFSPRDCKYHFCVVFRDDQKARFFNPSHIERSAILYGLEELNAEQGKFYDRIITQDIGFFKAQKQLHCH